MNLNQLKKRLEIINTMIERVEELEAYIENAKKLEYYKIHGTEAERNRDIFGYEWEINQVKKNIDSELEFINKLKS